MGNDAARKILKGGVKVKMIKVFNDFVLGVVMIGVSLYLLIGNIATNIPKTSQGGYLSRADVWIKMLAVMLLVVSIILVFKSINFKKGETKKFEFFLDNAIVSTIVGLIAYTVLLPKIGFFISTFSLTFFYVVLYTVSEDGKKFRTLTKEDVIRIGGKGLISSALLLAVFWLIFAKLLAVQLPVFSLFM